MHDDEIQFAVRLARVDMSERKSIEMKSSGSSTVARDAIATLQGKPCNGGAVKAWLSLIRRMAKQANDQADEPCQFSADECSDSNRSADLIECA